MRLCLLLATLSLALLLAPAASAVDTCDKYGICVPDDVVSECRVDGVSVIVDHCEPQVYQCDVYWSGGSPTILGGFHRSCYAVLA